MRLRSVVVLISAAVFVGFLGVTPARAEVVCVQSGGLGGATCYVTVEQGATGTRGASGKVTVGGEVCERVEPGDAYAGASGNTNAGTGLDTSGHGPDEKLYMCIFESDGAGSRGRLFWSSISLGGPDAEQLAQQAISSMDLQAPRIGIVPRPTTVDPGSVGLVGLQNWMWIDDPDPQTFGTNNATASAGDFSVTATAKVVSVDWDMGDGQVITCHGPGTVYNVDLHGFDPSPSCGHMYTKQGHYTITATAHWQVGWVGAGESGTITMDLTSSAPIVIGELQTVRRS